MRRSSRLVVTVACLLLIVGQSHAGMRFESALSTAQELPPPAPGLVAGASVVAEFDDALTQVAVRLRVDGGANVVAAHFHCNRAGQNGPVAFGLFSPGPLLFDGTEASGVLTNDDFNGADCVPPIGRPVNNIAALALAMRDGLIYVNVHTSDNPPGEVRGQLLPPDPGCMPSGGDGDDDDDDDDASVAGTLYLQMVPSDRTSVRPR